MASNLTLMLKRSYSVISQSLRGKVTSEWISDNFYVIHKHYRMILSNKKALCYEDLYGLLKKHCEDIDYNITPSSLTDYLLSQNREYGYYELLALNDLLSACAIIKIGEILKTSSGMSLLPNSVKLLFSLSDPRYGDILPDVWQIEPLIRNAEPSYNFFDTETKSHYRSAVADHARLQKISERESVKKLSSQAKSEDIPLGALLYRPKKTYRYFWLLTAGLIFALLCVSGFLTVGWLTVLLFVPFGLSSSSVADYITSRVTPAYRAPRLNIAEVPGNAKTLVTVAALMTGGDGDKEVFRSLSRFRCMNPDKNIYFCLLADLPDSPKKELPADDGIIANARKEIDDLNSLYGESFCLFFRKRIFNKSEEKYGGWERKRGAVCNLVSHIENGGSSEYYGGDFIRDIKYILTLDSDTNLSVGSVRELLSVALHPINRPIVKKGRVTSGYGIIQPSVRTELTSAYRTSFSRLISGAGGADVYANAEFQRSQSLFGSGNFCGKGLIDVKLFNKLVVGKLPDGLVLSHDCIEGSILNTLCASDITLTDSTPGNTVSFFRRQHRWIRGDFQNLYFLKGRLLSPLSKLRLLSSVLRHSSSIFILLTLMIGSFIPETSGLALFLLAYSEFLLPFGVSAVSFLFSGSPFALKRFFSKAYTMLTQSFLRLFFELTVTARRGILTLHAFALSAVRLVTRKKTLEWTTAAQAEKLSSSLGKYVLDGALSAVLGLLMLIFALPPFMRLCGLLYFVYPFVSTILSSPLNGGAVSRPALNESQKENLKTHARDMFRFYYDNVDETTNFLPPDNIQFSPVRSKAMRTSPTNIGFYLVSLLAARDLNAIDTEELFKRLDSSLTVIDSLEKYRGNLYNWYDIKNLTVIGERYVSTVDCGNFIVMLIALKEGISEYTSEKPELSRLISLIEKLISDADMTPLYDPRRELFKIGIKEGNESDEGGCYDLLMSEARMTAYYAVASSLVPKKHWQSLGRTLTHKSGYIGMKSWSGTAFEYLMPQLFLPLYRDSFMFESVAFSIMVQREANPIWGVSESGFYSFDSDMNYQYKANGLQALALRRISADEKIVSPYSSYLSLCVCGSAVMKNLRAFEARGMYGKYGLYEAIDFNNDSGGIAVKSYMAHHVGMSIIACLNAVSDNIFVRRFMSDCRMGAARELLQEKIPIDAHIFEDSVSQRRETKRFSERERIATDKIDLDSPVTALLTRGDMTAVISSSGHISLSSGERALTHTQFDKTSLRFSPGVIFSRGGKHFGCAKLYGEGSVYGFEEGNGSASHIASGKDFSGRVRYSISKNCNCFLVNTRAEALKKYDITLVFEPVLESNKKYLSHISFSRLFLESEYDKTRRILYFHRRSGLDGSHIFTLAVAPRDRATSFDFLTSRESFPASSLTSIFDYASAQTDNRTGSCIDPLCLVRASEAEGGRASFLITCGETKQECERNIRIARADRSDHIQPFHGDMLGRLLSALLYNSGGKTVEKFSDCSVGDLWSKSISGDYPLAVIRVGEVAVNRTESLLKAFLVLARGCIRCELVFITDDEDKYNRPAESSLRECCYRVGVSSYLGRGGGIFILRESELSPDLRSALRNKAAFYLDFSNDTRFNSDSASCKPEDIIALPENPRPLAVPENGIESHNGYFIPDGFVVDKSKLPSAPYSFILTGHRFSTVLTQSSLGYTFFDNARERRICSFFGDSRTLDSGERVFAVINGKKYDLCAVSDKVSYEKGGAVYYGEIRGMSYNVTVTVPPEYPVKLIRVKYSGNESVDTRFTVQPVMGDSVAQGRGIELKPFSLNDNQGFAFRNPFGMTFPEGYGFAGVCGGIAEAEHCTLSKTGNDVLFFLGACMSESGAMNTASVINNSFFDRSVSAAVAFAESFLPKIKVKTKSRVTDALFNFFLPYQVAACRFFARGSFYQSGGAYGFRDQLQDCLTLVYSSPHKVRTHIIRCCAHQYSEGSVMHWWHTRHFGNVNRGIKSKCSDDMLYLPIVTADYLEKTGDLSLLEVETHYLSSPPLGRAPERYEQPELSEEKESVYRHCLRALAHAEKKGRHGLLLMGSCDWNDAFSLVGEKGIGESVFTTFLFIIAAERFLPVIEKYGDTETASHYRKVISELRQAVNENAFFGDRFARAICDDGTVLGVEGCEECEIDILSQAFAALAGMDADKVKLALSTAFGKLYDRKSRIFKLFSPPFTNGSARVGYIRGYVAGIRENGGQYTHGALWGALGCIAAGMNEEALLILDCVNPASRVQDKLLAEKYKTEPYAVAADIYSDDHSGRGGWSWYTGAASWFYRILLENVFGVKLGANGAVLSAKPIVAYEMDMEHNGKRLHISAREGIGAPMLNGETALFPLILDKDDNILELPL